MSSRKSNGVESTKFRSRSRDDSDTDSPVKPTICQTPTSGSPLDKGPSGLTQFFKKFHLPRGRSKSPKRVWVTVEPQKIAANGHDLTDQKLMGVDSAQLQKVPLACQNKQNGKPPLSLPLETSLSLNPMPSEKRTVPIRNLGTPPPAPIRTISLRDSVCREAMSEEDLVSKTAFLASPNCLSVGANLTIMSYHSEESVFNPQPELKLETRSPSYIKISCALSGYRNYRGSRESITSPHLRSPGGGMPSNSPLVNKCSENLWASSSDRSQKENVCPRGAIHLPKGKSIVETRVERFQVPTTATNGDHSHLKLFDTSTADGSATPTPIKNIISTFNKLTLTEDIGGTPTGRPRPTKVPPPVPIKGPRRISGSTPDGNINGADRHQGDLRPTDDQAVLPVETNGGDGNQTTNGHTEVVAAEPSAVAECLRVPSVEPDDLCEAPTVSPVEIETGGHLYLAKLRKEEEHLINLSNQFAKDLESIADIPDEAAGTLRLALGKAGLLVRKKFSRFADLCDKHLKGELDKELKCQVLEADLDGYWQLVMIEVSDVLSLFHKFTSLRDNNWIAADECDSAPIANVSNWNPDPVNKAKRPAVIPKPKSSKPVENKEKEEARRQRIREMKAAAAMRLKSSGQSDDVEIFAPNS